MCVSTGLLLPGAVTIAIAMLGLESFRPFYLQLFSVHIQHVILVPELDLTFLEASWGMIM